MSQVIRITRGCEYAISTMLWTSTQTQTRPAHAEEIAKGVGMPSRFASNILADLANSGLLRAHRGASRGYSLGKPASQISLLDVIEAYDGPFLKPWCFADRERPCDAEHPCGLHDVWNSLCDCVKHALGKVTLAELTERDPYKETIPSDPGEVFRLLRAEDS